MKTIRWTAMVIFCLVGLICGLLSVRKEWVQPLSGVRLAPIRPILNEEDIPVGGAFDLLRQATDAPYEYIGTGGEWSQLKTNKWSDTIFTNLYATLTTSSTNLALAREAVLAGGGQVPTALSFSAKLTYVAGVRNLARVFSISAIRDSSQGCYDKAFSDLVVVMRFGNISSRGGGLINRLVAIACRGIGCGAMRRIASNHQVPDDVLVKAMQELDKIEDELEPWSEAFRYEYLVVSNYINSSSMDMKDFGMYPLPPVVLGLGPLLGSTREAIGKNFAHCYSHMVYMAEHPFDKKASAGLSVIMSGGQEWYEILSYQDPLGYVLANIVISNVSSATDRYLGGIVELRATRLFLAILRFKQKEDRLPSDLDDLVPVYINDIPLDVFDGKPLRYVSSTNDTWRIYSVGSDGIDNGGYDSMFRFSEPDIVVPFIQPFSE